MPFDVRPVGDQFCVFKAGDDKSLGCHPSEDKAQEQVAALSTDDDVMNFGSILDGSFTIDLFSNDGDVARRVLDGEPILIMPVGKHFRRGRVRDVTSAIIDQFADNFANRRKRGIRRERVAVDVDHRGGAVGWYKSITASSAGLMGTFSWNRRGREVLEDGEYAYFSPTVYWQESDPITGEQVPNQVAGGALTNYPFFGEATALYSLREGETFAVTKREGDEQYPSRAYLVATDPQKVGTWHLRVYSWQDDALKPDHGLMGAAKAALTAPGGHRGKRYAGPEKDAAISKLRALYKREDMDFSSGGGNMPDGKDELTGDVVVNGLRAFFTDIFRRSESVGDDDGGGGAPAITEEQFSELMSQVTTMSTALETLQGERDAFAARAEALEGQLVTVQDARATERFSVMAESFSYLPSETSALAQQLRWLTAADTDEGQPHVAFFSALLRKADEAFGDGFAAEGGRGASDAGSVLAQVNTLVTKFQADNAEVSYSDALSAVLTANPQLYETYRQEVAS